LNANTKDDAENNSRNADDVSSVNLSRLEMKIRRLKRKIDDIKHDMDASSFTNQNGSDFLCRGDINKKVALIREDITKLEVDGIVNAANSSLLGGGGIDGAIHRAAGNMLYRECKTLGGANTGETKITRGHNLPAKFVLHTVGPIGENAEKLEHCYLTCCELSVKHGLKSVALCGVSTGIYGYPLYPATHVALRTARRWLDDAANFEKVDLIVFCTYTENELDCYQKLMPIYFPPSGETGNSVAKSYETMLAKYDPITDAELTKELNRREKERQERKQMRLRWASSFGRGL